MRVIIGLMARLIGVRERSEEAGDFSAEFGEGFGVRGSRFPLQTEACGIVGGAGDDVKVDVGNGLRGVGAVVLEDVVRGCAGDFENGA